MKPLIKLLVFCYLAFISSNAIALTFKDGKAVEIEKSKILQLDGKYFLQWEILHTTVDKKTIIESWIDVIDQVNISNKDIKIIFGNADNLTDKYRKTVNLKFNNEDIILEGDIDISCDCPLKMKINLKREFVNEEYIYEGMGVWSEGKDKVEIVKVTLGPELNKNFISDIADYFEYYYTSYNLDSFKHLFNYSYLELNPIEVSGDLYIPKNKEKYSLIIFQHGTGDPSNRSNTSFQRLVIPKLIENGIAVFINDHYSKRNIKGKQRAWLNFPTRLADSIQIIKKLVNDNKLNIQKIGFTGWSYGGMETMFLAYEPIKKLHNNNVDAFLSFYPDCQYMIEGDIDKNLKVILAEKDNSTNPIICEKYLKQNNIDYSIYENANHGFISGNGYKFFEKTWTWYNCPGGGIINQNGYVKFDGKLFGGTQDEIDLAITNLCGSQGVGSGDTKIIQSKAKDDLIDFFNLKFKK